MSINNTEKEQSPEFGSGAIFNPYTEMVIKSWWELELGQGNHDVDIDYSQLLEFAKLCYRDQLEIPSWRLDGVNARDNLAFASNVLVHGTVNAAFNLPNGDKYAVLFGKGAPLTATFGMIRKFYENFGEEVLTTARLDEAFDTFEHTKNFFDAINEIPYPELRHLQLRDFVDNLLRLEIDPTDLLSYVSQVDSQGNVTGLRAFNSEDGWGLVDLLIQQFPLAYGADRQFIGRLDFPFYKRTQLAVLALHGRAINSDISPQSPILPFVDIDQIGPIADYEVPRSLRGLGILKFSNSLSKQIQSWQEIPKDSQEEIEIRAATVVACAILQKTINQFRQLDQLPQINMANLDYWLWSQAKKVAGDINPHLTKTMAY